MARRLRFVVWMLAGVVVLCAGLRATSTTTASTSSWVDALDPITSADWTTARAAHLLERAGFGGTPEDVARLAAMTPQQAVDSLVDYERIPDTAAQPFEESGIWDRGMDPFPPSRADAVRQARERGNALGVSVLPEG